MVTTEDAVNTGLGNDGLAVSAGGGGAGPTGTDSSGNETAGAEAAGSADSGAGELAVGSIASHMADEGPNSEIEFVSGSPTVPATPRPTPFLGFPFREMPPQPYQPKKPPTWDQIPKPPHINPRRLQQYHDGDYDWPADPEWGAITRR